MDITLERILSLIPRKPNGQFIHGAKKEFAQNIGMECANLISDWIAGRSCSYRQKLYHIAAVYGVSVEWLKGETDIKEPQVTQQETYEARDPADIDLLELIGRLSPAKKALLLAIGKNDRKNLSEKYMI